MDPVLSIPRAADARDRCTVELIGVLWVLALADLLFTLWADRYTPFAELNPWAGALLAQHRVILLAAAKLVLTAAGTLILWLLRHHRTARIALWGAVAVYVALMFRWSDYTSQVMAMGVVAP